MPQPHPTGCLGLLRIPGPNLNSLSVRFAPLTDRDIFIPANWKSYPLTKSSTFAGWWEIDLDLLSLPDARYEYEFILNGDKIVADPYADEITRFGGYRGIFTIKDRKRIRSEFRWDGEISPNVALPQNNQIVIYEMPVRWMSSDPIEDAQSMELGTIDEVIFEHLDKLANIGINCIELMPIQDSPQTLNWGYGTRFFFAPDYDICNPLDLKLFIKLCHQRGIRVILDVVMNMFSPPCPLSYFAPEWFYEPKSDDRNDWGQNLFHFGTPAYDHYFAAREFLFEMAEFWISEYHIDGYRVDEFKSINNWDFIQDFYSRSTAKNDALFPGKPFLIVAEDTNRRFMATCDDSRNPNHRKVIDAIWNFGYRDEIRRLLIDDINTSWGQPPRSIRVQNLISKNGVWDEGCKKFGDGYVDMACAVNYITSHDVADGCRLMNYLLCSLLGNANLGDCSINNVRKIVDSASASMNSAAKATVEAALHRVFGAFCILMTSVGIPMWLAGEEFADIHDTDYIGVNSKQQDPVQWSRSAYPEHADLMSNIAKLIKLRTSHPALQRNEIEFFYFHPQFDDNQNPRVFAYCRTNGQPLGNSTQVIIIANMGPHSFPIYTIPGWRWHNAALTELGYSRTLSTYNAMNGTLTLSLNPFEVRIMTT